MDDPHRQPSDRDRDRVAGRIKRAHELGQIGEADRTIRLQNVRSAQSMSELDLMTRELDQLKAALPAGSPRPDPAPGRSPTPSVPGAPAWRPGVPAAKARRTGGTAVIAVLVVVALVVGGIGAAVFVGFRAIRGAVESGVSASEPADSRPTGPAYDLTAEGISGFLQTYRERWGTSEVVDLVLYDGYAVVNVPVPGTRRRQEGWVYRDGSGFTAFGGIRASIPGAQVIDTDALDIPALVRNIARARKTLDVEDPAQAYVVIRHIRTFDEVPSVDIHVSNGFQESGYLATTLAGTVERAYPYAG